jgi:N-acetylmuramoyl-L-alanine amidase
MKVIQYSLIFLFISLLFVGCSPRQESTFVERKMPSDFFQVRKKEVNKRRLIVIDAGHGGEDSGAVAQREQVKEKDLCLEMGKYLQHYLSKMGYRCLMTRRGDYFIPLQERSKIANEYKASAFISLHFNTAANKHANGIEIYYFQSSKGDYSRGAKDLALSCLGRSLYYTKANSRGVKGADFSVLRRTKMPAILVEGGFISNKQELSLLNKRLYMKYLSWGVAKGIDDYFN